MNRIIMRVIQLADERVPINFGILKEYMNSPRFLLKGLCCAGFFTATVLAGAPDAVQPPSNETIAHFNFFAPPPLAFQKKLKITRPVSHKMDGALLYPGSLKDNIVRISQDYGWKQVIWMSPEDYHWIGKIRVAANNLPDILGKILKDYPLQANFYDGNHVLVIQPRTIQT